jgi:hypothetical protein
MNILGINAFWRRRRALFSGGQLSSAMEEELIQR